jgi:hypothetical protein
LALRGIFSAIRPLHAGAMPHPPGTQQPHQDACPGSVSGAGKAPSERVLERVRVSESRPERHRNPFAILAAKEGNTDGAHRNSSSRTAELRDEPSDFWRREDCYDDRPHLISLFRRSSGYALITQVAVRCSPGVHNIGFHAIKAQRAGLQTISSPRFPCGKHTSRRRRCSRRSRPL